MSKVLGSWAEALGEASHPHSAPCLVPVSIQTFTTCLLGPLSFHPSLKSPFSSATSFRVRIAATFSDPFQGSSAAMRPGLRLPPRQQASLLFSLESLFQWASLQQGAASRDPQQGGRKNSNDEQVPNHCQAQGGHGGLQTQGGFLHGQPGSAGTHIS